MCDSSPKDGGGARLWPVLGMSDPKDETGLRPARPAEDKPRRALVHPTAPATVNEHPGLRGQRERPSGRELPRGSGRARDGTRRPGRTSGPPVSARTAMDGAPQEPTALEALPARVFQVDGTWWIARETGHTSIGFGASATAVLLQVSFSKKELPDVIAFETLVAVSSLDGMGEEQLTTLLAEGRIPPSPTVGVAPEKGFGVRRRSAPTANSPKGRGAVGADD